ncbi:MAG: FHIPEP family type III secretion protein, partial [Planctomycetes bacterium]|nr:FHIPEP family type III secretion protein [Planctomycetota bacterium]
MREYFAKSSDLVFAVAVLVVVSLMIVPVPPAAMDFLIATNISAAILTLLVALYAHSAIKLPSFPTLLLLATLFRLALNVASTKLILGEANAGSIIDAFGEFVVGGNLVVGAVVFLVLVL